MKPSQKYEIERKPDTLIMKRKANPDNVLIIIGTAIFGTILIAGIFWYAYWIGKEDTKVALTIPAPFLLFAIWALYKLAVIRFNTIQVISDSEKLKVKYGPIPHPGSKSIKKADVESLDVIEEKVKYTRKKADAVSGDRPEYDVSIHTYFNIVAKLKDGHSRVLMKRHTGSEEEARFVKEQLEQTLSMSV